MGPAQTSRRQINAKALLILLGVFAALAVSVHFLHGFQLKRNAGGLLQEATQAEQNGDAGKAIDYLGQYLRMVHHDVDAQARYALLVEQQARTPRQLVRVLDLFEEVLRQDGEREEIRRHAVELAMKGRRFSAAARHVEILRRKYPKDASLALLQAHCDIGERKPEAARQHMKEAVELSPDDASLHLEYALSLREKWGRAAEGDRVMDNLVKARGNSLAVRVAAAHYARWVGRKAQAEMHLEVARTRLEGRDPDLFLLSAGLAAQGGDLARARTFLEEGARLNPGDARLTQELARLDLREGRKDDARKRLGSLAVTLPSTEDELWSLGALYIEAGDLERGQAIRDRLEELRFRLAARFLQARLLMSQDSWGEAGSMLEKVLAARAGSPPLRRSTGLQLALCYRHLLSPDQEIAASKRLLVAFPAWPPAQQQLASALAAAGKREEALLEYAKIQDPTPAVVEEMADLLLARNLTLPRSERSWTEVKKLAAQLKSDRSTAARGRRLEARILAAQGEREAALRLLEDEHRRDPRSVPTWLLRITLTEEDNAAAVPTLLEQAERQAGPSVEWDLVRTRSALRAGPEQARKELPSIEARLAALTDSDQDRLRAALADAYARSGEASAAIRLGRQLADRQKSNLAPRFLLFERAMQDGQDSDARALMEEMRVIEGGSGPMSLYAEAALLSRAAFQGDRQALARARDLLEEAALLRPSWPRVPLLQARLLEKDNPEQAVVRYLAALERGEDRVDVVQHVIQLLASRGHSVEALNLFRKLPEAARQDLGKVAAELTLLGGESEGAARVSAGKEALRLAKRVAHSSRDYRDYLWLGRIAVQAGQIDEAKTALGHATEMAPDRPEPWVTFILFLADKDVSRAEAELEKASARLVQQKGALAPCYEALGKVAQAEKEYQAVLEGNPDDARALEGLAGLYVRTEQPVKAEPMLRRLLDPQLGVPSATAGWARRTLALNLALAGGYARFKEARSLVSRKQQDKLEEERDVPVRAQVLATRPEHRKAAIRLLEELPQGQLSAQPELHFVLAQLYEQDGSWAQAKGELLLLLEARPKNSRYLAYSIRALLRHDQAAQADDWLERLQELLPGAPETVELQARALHATGRTEKARQLVLAWADKKGRLELAAGLLEQLGIKDDAARLFRRLVEKSNEPARLLALAGFLARSGSVDEALEACDRAAAEKVSPLAVLQARCAAVQSPGATESQRRQVEQRLQAALAENPAAVNLTVSLAQLQEQRGRFAEAVETYRRSLEKNPHNPSLQRNLAYLLALTGGDNEEALRLIDTAIEQEGPVAELLDTRALVHLASDRADEAVTDLEQAVMQVPAAVKYFHLALACKQAGKLPAWRDARDKARELGFKTLDLPPVELRRWKDEAHRFGG